MTKVFISQPMNGKSDEEIKDERRRLEIMARALFEGDVSIIDSVIKDSEDDAKPLWYLGRSLELMSKADAVVFASGWQNYRGCRIEHACAFEYGIKFIEL